MQEHTPLTWLQEWTSALGWPVIVLGAFLTGRYVTRLEGRVLAAEKNVKDLIERHLPHVHRALTDIQGKLNTVIALVQKGK